MNHQVQILVILLSLLTFLALLGCTDSGTIPGIPFTAQQFFSKVTDLNYYEFQLGVYDGNFVVVDGNKLSIAKIDINSYNIDWSKLINFPIGCGVNQAVKIVGSSLVCVDLPVDTNTQTVGWTDASGTWIDLNATKIDTNLIENDSNKSYGIQYCADGNIIVGYLVGYSC